MARSESGDRAEQPLVDPLPWSVHQADRVHLSPPRGYSGLRLFPPFEKPVTPPVLRDRQTLVLVRVRERPSQLRARASTDSPSRNMSGMMPGKCRASFRHEPPQSVRCRPKRRGPSPLKRAAISCRSSICTSSPTRIHVALAAEIGREGSVATGIDIRRFIAISRFRPTHSVRRSLHIRAYTQFCRSVSTRRWRLRSRILRHATST